MQRRRQRRRNWRGERRPLARSPQRRQPGTNIMDLGFLPRVHRRRATQYWRWRRGVRLHRRQRVRPESRAVVALQRGALIPVRWSHDAKAKRRARSRARVRAGPRTAATTVEGLGPGNAGATHAHTTQGHSRPARVVHWVDSRHAILVAMHRLVQATTRVIGEVRKRGSARRTRRGPRETLPLRLLPLSHPKERRAGRRVPGIRHVCRMQVGQRARLRGPLTARNMRALQTVPRLRKVPTLAMAGLAQTRLSKAALSVTPHAMACVTDAARAVTRVPVAALPVSLIPPLTLAGVTQARRQGTLAQHRLAVPPLAMATEPVTPRREPTRPQHSRMLHGLRASQVRRVARLPVARRTTAIVTTASNRPAMQRAMPVAGMAQSHRPVA